MVNKCKIGVFGLWRGSAYIAALNDVADARVTAICDIDPNRISEALKLCPSDTKTFSDFNEFIDSGIDAVILTNYFNEHVPYAIKAMEKGIHVLSETIAASTLKECVDLCRAVERTGCKYMLAENYPFMLPCIEMKRVYEDGTLGKVIYAEGEYVHPTDIATSNMLAPNEKHWRMLLPRTYYSSHALAPLMHMTDTIPKKVNARTGFDADFAIKRNRDSGDIVGVILCEMDNGSLFRVTGNGGFGPHGNWYRLGCINGGIEATRDNPVNVRLEYNSWSKPEGVKTGVYTPVWGEHGELAEKTGHGGGDFWVVYNFIKYMNEDIKPFFDVYRSVAMAAVGILGWKSVLEDGATQIIPDFKNEEERKKVENDDLTPFYDSIGNPPTLPHFSKSI